MGDASEEINGSNLMKGVTTVYEGNPLVDNIENSSAYKEGREDFLSRGSLNGGSIMAFLPGNREAEINFLVPIFVSVSRVLGSKYRLLLATVTKELNGVSSRVALAMYKLLIDKKYKV